MIFDFLKTDFFQPDKMGPECMSVRERQTESQPTTSGFVGAFPAAAVLVQVTVEVRAEKGKGEQGKEK